MSDRRRTSTSSFGVSRREAHDAAAFYARFEPPELSSDDTVALPEAVDEPFQCADARRMEAVADGSVALVVTSPPYFAGKRYEEELDREGVPSSYLEYLELLRDVFAECKRKLEPGGRIAVNVANLGRKPYRSLSGDVMRILEDDLRLLPRGEIVWQKGEGASGSCAWGSFRSPTNPVLRDITERVIVVSKGRFDRALPATERRRRGLPHERSCSSDEFMAATLDVWEIAPESARRVQHPAPFPVELPERLIHLYTFVDDLVLDPFMGSGSTLVAAARTGRRYVGYDLDPSYVAIARSRVAEAARAPSEVVPLSAPRRGRRARVPAAVRSDEGDTFLAQANRKAKAVQAIAEEVVEKAGFAITGRAVRLSGLGLSVPIVAEDAGGTPWYFDVSGAFTTTRSGLARTETVWKALGRASVLAGHGCRPLVLLTSHLPKRGTEGETALRAAGPDAFFDAVEMLSEAGRSRLAAYAAAGPVAGPVPGFWRAEELEPPTARRPRRARRRTPA